MNRLRDCFDDAAGDEIGAGPTFQGGRLDPEADLIDFTLRHYSRKVVPFMPPDSVAYVEGEDTYLSTGDDPAHPVDPLGT